jgi:hypothetical protein
MPLEVNRRARLTIAVAAIALVVAPAAEAKRPFPNCTAVAKKHAHGIAKSAKTARSADGFTGTPFISATLYAQEKGLDRDHDGVACER